MDWKQVLLIFVTIYLFTKYLVPKVLSYRERRLARQEIFIKEKITQGKVWSLPAINNGAIWITVLAWIFSVPYLFLCAWGFIKNPTAGLGSAEDYIYAVITAGLFVAGIYSLYYMPYIRIAGDYIEVQPFLCKLISNSWRKQRVYDNEIDSAKFFVMKHNYGNTIKKIAIYKKDGEKVVINMLLFSEDVHGVLAKKLSAFVKP